MAEAKLDAETLAFANDVAEPIRQAKRGELADVHTPEMIAGYTAQGRPCGTCKVGTEHARYSPDVLEALKATVPGWQARISEALREWRGQRWTRLRVKRKKGETGRYPLSNHENRHRRYRLCRFE